MTFGAKALVVVLLALAAPAGAAEWSVDALGAALRQDPSARVAFTEERHISYLKVPLVSRGVLQFKDDVLRKTVTSPTNETFEIRQHEVVHIGPGDETTRIALVGQPVLQSLAVILRSILTGNLEPVRNQFDMSLSGNSAHWDLDLSPRTNELRHHLDRVALSGTRGRLDEIVVAERNGDRTVISIRDE